MIEDTEWMNLPWEEMTFEQQATFRKDELLWREIPWEHMTAAERDRLVREEREQARAESRYADAEAGFYR